jgi:hypothetical protein
MKINKDKLIEIAETVEPYCITYNDNKGSINYRRPSNEREKLAGILPPVVNIAFKYTKSYFKEEGFICINNENVSIQKRFDDIELAKRLLDITKRRIEKRHKD